MEKCRVKKVKSGYRVVGKNGRNMGTYKTEDAAQYRLEQIERMKRDAIS